MRKLILAGVLVAPLVMAAGVAEATPILFEDFVELNEYMGPGDAFLFMHDINDDLSAEADILQATLSLYLADDQDGRADEFEVSLVLGEGGVFGFGSPEVGDFEVDVAALDDGFLFVTVSSVAQGDIPAGDFLVVNSTLSGVYEPVPEPATLVLFVMGGTVVMFSRNRLRKKKK